MKRTRKDDFVVYRPTKRQKKRNGILYSEEEFEKELLRRMEIYKVELAKKKFEDYDYIS